MLVFDQTGPGTGVSRAGLVDPGWMMLDSIPAGGKNAIELGPETIETSMPSKLARSHRPLPDVGPAAFHP